MLKPYSARLRNPNLRRRRHKISVLRLANPFPRTPIVLSPRIPRGKLRVTNHAPRESTHRKLRMLRNLNINLVADQKISSREAISFTGLSLVLRTFKMSCLKH